MPSYNRCKLITVKMSRWVAIVILIVGIVCALYKNYFLEELQLQYECHWNATHQALTIVKLRRDLHECKNEYDAVDKQWKECQTEREFDLNTAKWQYQNGFQQAVVLSVVIVVVVIILLYTMCLSEAVRQIRNEVFVLLASSRGCRCAPTAKIRDTPIKTDKMTICSYSVDVCEYSYIASFVRYSHGWGVTLL